jgi:hypothetical protein
MLAGMMALGPLWSRLDGEMAVVMVAPFVLLLLPYGPGMLPGPRVTDLGHGLMPAAMVALMIVRRDHYAAAPTWVFRRRTTHH